jgi:hypothetical protein
MPCTAHRSLVRCIVGIASQGRMARQQADSTMMRMHAEQPHSSQCRAAATDDWGEAVPQVRAEYTERPGMRLTALQAARLCGLEPFVCSLVLRWLIDERFLRLSNGFYIKNIKN